jgi:predicted  nucleic acid-binding Zn-ribbon protein
METTIQAATPDYVEKLRADFNNKIIAMNQENTDIKEANKRELKAFKQEIIQLSQKETPIQSQMSSSTTDDMLSKMTQHSLRISGPAGKCNKFLSKIEELNNRKDEYNSDSDDSDDDNKYKNNFNNNNADNNNKVQDQSRQGKNPTNFSHYSLNYENKLRKSNGNCMRKSRTMHQLGGEYDQGYEIDVDYVHTLDYVHTRHKHHSPRITHHQPKFIQQPIYHGNENEDIENWIFKIEMNFQCNNTPAHLKSYFAQFYLEGSALEEFKSNLRITIDNKEELTWRNLLKALRGRFRQHNFESRQYIKLIETKKARTQSVRNYIDTYQEINKQLKNEITVLNNKLLDVIQEAMQLRSESFHLRTDLAGSRAELFHTRTSLAKELNIKSRKVECSANKTQG